jgi:beta-galactosidase/beta-glucuronidase
MRRSWILIIPLIALFGRPGVSGDIPRAEYPRPDFERAAWLSLNGTWEFQFDDQNEGLSAKWYAQRSSLQKKIVVPYCFQSKLSGIADTAFHDVMWYRRPIRIPQEWKGRHVRLNFGAVDYRCQVWLNGESLGPHEGGQTPFSFDITSRLLSSPGGENLLVVRAEDPSTDRSIPRGKQYWEPKSRGIWYTRTSGIWQPVWLEAVPDPCLQSLLVRPNVDDSSVSITARLNRPAPDLRLRVKVDFKGELQGAAETRCTGEWSAVLIQLPAQHLWSPEQPDLYDISLEVYQGNTLWDSVKSYLGQRKISTQDGRVLLNNRPYFLKMVLDQGYWPESILTPPTDEAIQYDIKMTRDFGFNGARKHQKVEDPRYLYWADKMGLLVSGEMANAQVFNEDYVSRMVREWTDVVLRDINHCSIISWYPINESWGVPQVHSNRRQQDHMRTLYYLTRSLDPSRLIVDNDGWDHSEATDLFTIHDYSPKGETLETRYAGLPDVVHRAQPGQPALIIEGGKYNGTPFVISEFGGIAYRPTGLAGRSDEWGYSGVEPTEEAFLSRFDGLIKALRRSPAVAGYCYTQLTDVEQEINGLMTYGRKPKADPEKIRKAQQ